jgi:prepilin-type processing-associated H-X9-DG protein
MIAIGDYPPLAYTKPQPTQWPVQDGDIVGSATDDAEDTLAARHNLGCNVVFCDAHIEYAKQKKWLEASEPARQRWNNDHLPHPETWH